MNSLKDPQVARTLDRLHTAAKGDWLKLYWRIPIALAKMAMGKSFSEAVTPESMKDVYIPVDRDQGEFMYLLARSINAKTIVEFGTSFGISTIYLAAALRDNGGGTVIGTEIEPTKHKTANANLAEAGLAQFVDIRLGDALQTLKSLPDNIDLLLLDGWKDLYPPVVELVKPHLRKGAIVVADNIYTFKKALRPFVDSMQNGKIGFESTTLSLSDGFEFSVYTGETR
jgi:predicted O-methyltransferase YrrM